MLPILQGMGVMIGALFMDFERSLIAAAVSMLTLMLLGGFYIERLPPWLEWAQYVSFISHIFRATVEFGFLGLDLRYSLSNCACLELSHVTLVGVAPVGSASMLLAVSIPVIQVLYYSMLLSLELRCMKPLHFRCLGMATSW